MPIAIIEGQASSVGAILVVIPAKAGI